MTTEPATVISSEVRTMVSQNSGKKYRISIGLPYAYHESRGSGGPFDKPLEQWPVVYLVDGDLYFGMVTDIVRAMAWCETTTDAIVIGIGYPQNKDPQEAWRLSICLAQQGLTPARDEASEKGISAWVKRSASTGGASDFLKFIRYELIPTIDKDFRTDSKKRILAGHSFGGHLCNIRPFCSARFVFDLYCWQPCPGARGPVYLQLRRRVSPSGTKSSPRKYTSGQAAGGRRSMVHPS